MIDTPLSETRKMSVGLTVQATALSLQQASGAKGRELDVRSNAPIVGLVVDTSCDGDRVDLKVAGELDVVSSARLQEHVEQIGGAAQVVLDLSDVSFLDSTGLRCLWGIRERARLAGGKVILRSPSYAVLRVLQTMKLEDQFAADER